VVVTLTAFVVFGHPSSSPKIGSSSARISAFYLAHHGDEEIAAGLLAVVAALLAVFVTSCRAIMPPTNRTWSALFAAGGLIGSASFLLAGAVHLALAKGASHHLNPSALQALNALDINTSLGFTAGIGIMLLGAAGTLVPSTRALRVAGWVAVPLAIINLTPAGVALFPVTTIWIVATGILLSRRSDPSTQTIPTPALAT
jgi:hypothetical protein